MCGLSLDGQLARPRERRRLGDRGHAGGIAGHERHRGAFDQAIIEREMINGFHRSNTISRKADGT